MRRSMATALWQFSTTRMLEEYTNQLYLPAAGHSTTPTDPADTREPVAAEAS
jgi:hypothetical protein